MTTTLKRTPLFELYKQYGGKIIDFGGWELPVQFASIIDEHVAVRTQAGLFDVSHMGEITVMGEEAQSFLQHLLTNDISNLSVGDALYTAMCYENGGTVDDLLVYKKEDTDYLLVVNAANTEKDYNWMKSHKKGNVEIKNISSDIAQLALQGPRAEDILQKLTNTNLSEIGFFKFKDDVEIFGTKALISRTGYTGEDGFEIYLKAQDGPRLWEEILKAGEIEGIVPVGLGARDTLRFEAKLALYGQELSENITPLEAGIGFAVKLNKTEDFIGKDALRKQKEEGLTRKLVGIKMIDKGIPRHGYEVFCDDLKIGEVTTGTKSPTLNENLGLALIDIDYTTIGTVIEVQVRKKRLKAEVVKTPFYKR